MSNNNLAGFPAYGSRVNTSITYHPKELLFDPTQDIPSSEPGTAQVQFTIEQGDLPTFSPYNIPYGAAATFYNKYAFFLWVSVQNPTAGSITVTCKYKTANTPTWTTSGSAVGANSYGCCMITGISQPVLGDVQEVKVYATATGAKLLKAYMFAMPNYLGGGLYDTSIKNVEINLSAVSPIGGLAVTTSTSYWRNYFAAQAATGNASFTAPIGYIWSSSWGFGIAATPSATWYTSATESLRHWCPFYPTRIAYTPIL